MKTLQIEELKVSKPSPRTSLVESPVEDMIAFLTDSLVA